MAKITYSAKKAAASKDIGKPGKQFAMPNGMMMSDAEMKKMMANGKGTTKKVVKKK